VTYVLPPKILGHLDAARQAAIEKSLPQALEMMADGTRAGLGLADAIRLVASKAPPPVSSEFRVLVQALELGASLERTLSDARASLRTPNARLMISALLINQRSGGDVARILERVSRATRQLDQVQQKIESETASVRFSARAMVATIPLFAAVLYLMDPSATASLFNSYAGNIILCVVIGLAVIGYRSIMRLAQPDI
jgi:tight adherence protein B